MEDFWGGADFFGDFWVSGGLKRGPVVANRVYKGDYKAGRVAVKAKK